MPCWGFVFFQVHLHQDWLQCPGVEIGVGDFWIEKRGGCEQGRCGWNTSTSAVFLSLWRYNKFGLISRACMELWIPFIHSPVHKACSKKNFWCGGNLVVCTEPCPQPYLTLLGCIIMQIEIKDPTSIPDLTTSNVAERAQIPQTHSKIVWKANHRLGNFLSFFHELKERKLLDYLVNTLSFDGGIAFWQGEISPLSEYNEHCWRHEKTPTGWLYWSQLIDRLQYNQPAHRWIELCSVPGEPGWILISV